MGITSYSSLRCFHRTCSGSANAKGAPERQSRKVGWKTQSHNSFSQVWVHFWSRGEGREPPLNCLWSCCSGSCASVEGRLLKALVHCCITTSYSHHRLYHPLLFDVFLGLGVRARVCLSVMRTVCVRVCVWRLSRSGGPEKLLCVRSFKVIEAREGQLFSYWSEHKWAVVTACEMNGCAAGE